VSEEDLELKQRKIREQILAQLSKAEVNPNSSGYLTLSLMNKTKELRELLEKQGKLSREDAFRAAIDFQAKIKDRIESQAQSSIKEGIKENEAYLRAFESETNRIAKEVEKTFHDVIAAKRTSKEIIRSYIIIKELEKNPNVILQNKVETILNKKGDLAKFMERQQAEFLGQDAEEALAGHSIPENIALKEKRRNTATREAQRLHKDYSEVKILSTPLTGITLGPKELSMQKKAHRIYLRYLKARQKHDISTIHGAFRPGDLIMLPTEDINTSITNQLKRNKATKAKKNRQSKRRG